MAGKLRGCLHFDGKLSANATAASQFGANLEPNEYIFAEKSTPHKGGKNDDFIADLKGTMVTGSKHGHVIRILW